uniref:Parkin coregulated gene protein homolog n=1 Tax=Panagrellus redivivus TaxID=6233 RepID=A0A7E4VCW8_PANRE
MIAYDITRKCQQPRWRSVSPAYRVPVRRNNIVADNKRDQILYRKETPNLRKVPAFTIQTEQKHTRPFTPAKPKRRSCSIQLNDANKRFIGAYEDRRLPLRLVPGVGMRKTVEWQLDPNHLRVKDARELLKQLATGLHCDVEPYSTIALHAFRDMLTTAHAAQIVAEAMTDIVPHIRSALFSPSFAKRIEVLEILDTMASLNGCGQLLVPFYRQLLPPFRRNNRTSISTDISTTHRERYWSRVDKTLENLERTGGPTAFINIKYILPHYASVFT